MNNNEINHYGVPGMKWGVRKDKSSTNRAIKRDRKRASRNRRTLSDKELNSRINRLQSEKKLKKLTAEDVRPGRSAVKTALLIGGTSAITGLASAATTQAGKKIIRDLTGVDLKTKKK